MNAIRFRSRRVKRPMGAPLLNKFGTIRANHVGHHASIPQAVLLGDHPAGKAEVIRGLTGVGFPQELYNTTRFPTEVICRRGKTYRARVYIRPGAEANEERVALVRAFHRDVTHICLRSPEFHGIFLQGRGTMELRERFNDDNVNAPCFSEDILVIEIFGPDVTDLTVIDIPVEFEDSLADVPDVNDKTLCSYITGSYVNGAQSILIPVMQAAPTEFTEKLLDFVKECDPSGSRTIPILVRPNERSLVDSTDPLNGVPRGLLSGFDHGCFMVHSSRVASTSSGPRFDHISFRSKGNEDLDIVGFGHGYGPLRQWLSAFLVAHAEKGTTPLMVDMWAAWAEREKIIQATGPTRVDEQLQRDHVEEIGTRFSKMVSFILAVDDLQDPDLKNPYLRVSAHLEVVVHAFANVLFAKGHDLGFDNGALAGAQDHTADAPTAAPSTSAAVSTSNAEFLFEIPNDKEGYFSPVTNLLSQPFVSDEATNGGLMDQVRLSAASKPSLDITTEIDSKILCKLFKTQVKKWRNDMVDHVSKAILGAHLLVDKTLDTICPVGYHPEQVRAWALPEVRDSYEGTVVQALTIVDTETRTNLVSVTPLLEEVLNKFAHRPRTDTPTPPAVDEEEIGRTIRGIIEAHYDEARTCLMDAVYQQVVARFLVVDSHSVLRFFTPELVQEMTDRASAGLGAEAYLTEFAREVLEDDIMALERSMLLLLE